MFGRKKKKEVLEDDFGPKDLPYRTSKRAMKDSGVYPVRKRTRRQEDIASLVIKFTVIGTILFMVFSMIAGLLANRKATNLEETVAGISSPAFKARYESLGKTVVSSYFSGGNAPVNLFSTVSWGSANGTQTGNTQSQGQGVFVEAEALSLVDAYQKDVNPTLIPKELRTVMVAPKVEVLAYTGVIDGKQYKFGISLLIPNINDPNVLPYLMYAPSILPMDTLISVDAELSRPTTPHYREFQTSQTVLDTIDRWASAYAQNDREVLKRITGDPDPTRQYSGVGGFTLQGSASVLWAYEFIPEGQTADIAIMRVSFSMSTPTSTTGGEVSASGREQSKTLIVKQTMDIMIYGFSKGTPNIVGWTHGGDWENLNSDLNVEIVPSGAQESTTSTNTSVRSTASTPTSSAPSLARTTTSSAR